MGIEILFLTNASGGINPEFAAGGFYDDPGSDCKLCSFSVDRTEYRKLGTRFPDMTHIYDEELQHLIRETAAEERVPLREGVYLQTTGPNF